MEDSELFSWSDGGANHLKVRQAGPLHFIVETRHGPAATLVRLGPDQLSALSAALVAHLERVDPVRVVEQVLRLNTGIGGGEDTPTVTTVRTAVWVVEALRAQGFLPTAGGESEST